MNLSFLPVPRFVSMIIKISLSESLKKILDSSIKLKAWEMILLSASSCDLQQNSSTIIDSTMELLNVYQ